MTRRDALKTLLISTGWSPTWAAKPSVTTLIGTGAAGYSEQQVNNPYGLVTGPDRALYFCDLDNQRIRRLDLRTRRISTVAGNGQKAYTGDGERATAASLNMPHEIQFDAEGHLYIAERDNHVIRKYIPRENKLVRIAGTAKAGRTLNDDPLKTELNQPHGVAVDGQGRIYIADSSNGRVLRLNP